MDLTTCIPKDKHDTDAVERAAALGFPTINPILPDLLEWVQDANWPVAQRLFPLLAKAGPEITPLINAIFEGDDVGWKYDLMPWLVKDLRPEVARLLRANVVRIATNPTEEERLAEVDDNARDVIAHWGW